MFEYLIKKTKFEFGLPHHFKTTTAPTKNVYTIKDATQKIEIYCGYLERCHKEVVSKLRSMKMYPDEIGQIMVHLIPENFLKEERFVCSFTRQKIWESVVYILKF